MSHSIRLRGPWRVEPLGRAITAADGSWRLMAEDLQPPSTANVPADWGESLGSDFRGLARHIRKFHRPTGLDADSRVWLVIENVDFQAAITLNGHPLGLVQLAGSPAVLQVFDQPATPILCPARFDITALLAAENYLALDILLPPDSAPLPRPGRLHLPGGLIGLVRLEIEQAERPTSDRTKTSGRALDELLYKRYN